MAFLEKLRLKLDTEADGSTDYEYDIYPITGEIQISSTKNAMSIAPPGLAASDNILLGLSGMEADLTIPFAVWADGEDRANATADSDVVSVIEQTTYLEQTMHDPGFSATWQLDHLTGDAFDDDKVFLESVDVVPISMDSRKWTPATLRLRRGGST
ncbi:MAG: hypothetical protein ACOCSF_06590 [Halanaeroarchaeum sp.]